MKNDKIEFDELVKSQKIPVFVIPAKAGMTSLETFYETIKFNVVFKQLFAENGIGQIPHFYTSISSYMGDLSDVFSC